MRDIVTQSAFDEAAEESEMTMESQGSTTGKEDGKIVKFSKTKGHSRKRHASIQQFAERSFIWDHCPYFRQLREEGKSITPRHTSI